MPAEGDSAATGLAAEDPVGSDNEPPKHGATGTKRRVAARWSNANDETMVSILEKNKTEGRQADSGWKPGVWTEVSRELQGGPGGVKTVKSCQDRWRTLLKEYNTVHWLVTQVSGFGWDEDLKKVTATDDVWDDFLKKHTKVTKYRTRGFPLYDRIAALVEGKQATGEQALRIENVTSTSHPSTATPSASKGSRRQSQTTTSSQERAITWSPSPPPAPQTPKHGRGRSLTRSPASGHQSGHSSSDSGSRSPRRRRTKRTKASSSPSPRRSLSQSPKASASTKRQRITGPVAVNNVAGAMSQVAATFGSTAMEIATPTRRQRAVQMVSTDKTLSIPIRLRAMKLFTKDIAVCDSYLAIKDADLRNSFLTDLLESEAF